MARCGPFSNQENYLQKGVYSIIILMIMRIVTTIQNVPIAFLVFLLKSILFQIKTIYTKIICCILYTNNV